MSLADFLRGNLPMADDADPQGEDPGVKSFPVTWKTTSVTIPEDEHTIFAAVRYNDTQRIDQLLRQGFDVNTVHKSSPCLLRKNKVQKSVAMQLNEYSPLHIACLHSSMEVIHLLLEGRADINIKDSTNRTPLHYATLANRPDVVNLCIESGADVNQQTSSGKSALMYAVQEKNLGVVRALLDAGAEVNLKDVKGGTALEICLLSAGKKSNSEIVQALLQAGSDPNTENLYKATPLMLAAGAGQLDVINVLLDSGANINHEDNKGKTALHICCEHTRMTRAGRLLLSKGADINHRDHSGKTPLDRAVQQRKIGTVMFLLQADCARDSNLMKSETIQELCKMYPPLLMFLEYEFNQPWSLLRLCRFNIRNAIEPDKLKTVPEKLFLPRTLMQYVTLSN